jgi:hypothetical protein
MRQAGLLVSFLLEVEVRRRRRGNLSARIAQRRLAN